MIRYKIDVLEALKKEGYSTYVLRSRKLIGEKNIQSIREGKIIGITTLDTICGLLGLQPGDILEYDKDEYEDKEPC